MDRRSLIKLLGTGGAGLALFPSVANNLLRDEALTRELFGNDFVWGAATAAYQTEGAWNTDGKGPSIWDTFAHTPGKIYQNQNADTACNFYSLYEEDIDRLKFLNFSDFRFSIAWTRILPQGTGQKNQKGIDFYHRVIDKCLKEGITPWVTLFHWDLPQALEYKGGWTNRDIVNWFGEYVDICTKEYGDKVKNWMVLNEPMSFTALGYFLGIHAPGRKGLKNFLPAVHHTALCQAEGGRIAKNNVKDGMVGSTFSCSHIDPVKAKEKHKKAARNTDALLNRLFLEPALGLGYPTIDLPFLKRIEKYMLPEDEQKLPFDFDFIGLQNYTREVVKHWVLNPAMWAKQIPATKRNVELTEMGWEVFPEGIYYLLKKFNNYPQVKKIYITENGAAFPDTVTGDLVHDKERVKFIQSYLKQVADAKKEGVKVQGYFYWSFLDNFEWAEGFHPRFGLVHVDYETQKRIIKDSGWWFKDFLANT